MEEMFLCLSVFDSSRLHSLAEFHLPCLDSALSLSLVLVPSRYEQNLAALATEPQPPILSRSTRQTWHWKKKKKQIKGIYSMWLHREKEEPQWHYALGSSSLGGWAGMRFKLNKARGTVTKHAWSRCGSARHWPIFSLATVSPARRSGEVSEPCELSFWKISSPGWHQGISPLLLPAWDSGQIPTSWGVLIQ